MKKLALTTLAVLACATAPFAQATPTSVFSDGFDDGDVSDWRVSHSANISAPQVTTRSDAVHSGAGALFTYFDAPGGGAGAGYVYATHSFTAGAAGDYLLELWARSAPCSGCTMHFDVLVDDVLLARDGSAPNDYLARSFTLAGLAVGEHTLTLGMYTDAASSGRFNASFDDVRISTEAVSAVPEPGTLPLLAAAGLVVLALGKRRLPG